ncbi:hypothetical protein BD413DRAFT_258119 [Trametes elegans]|nr:hypothetical protein BD413DRAFT_258119 [Trametes elegans]
MCPAPRHCLLRRQRQPERAQGWASGTPGESGPRDGGLEGLGAGGRERNNLGDKWNARGDIDVCRREGRTLLPRGCLERERKQGGRERWTEPPSRARSSPASQSSSPLAPSVGLSPSTYMTRLNGLDQLREQEPHAFPFFLSLPSTNTSIPPFRLSLCRPARITSPSPAYARSQPLAPSLCATPSAPSSRPPAPALCARSSSPAAPGVHTSRRHAQTPQTTPATT